MIVPTTPNGEGRPGGTAVRLWKAVAKRGRAALLAPRGHMQGGASMA